MNKLRWYIVYTKPKFEYTVYEGIRRRGIETFLPTITETHQWSDRKKQVEVPLFPGYVFVKHQKTHLYEILTIRGVVSFVCFGDEFAELKEEEVERISQLLKGNFQIKVTEDLPNLEIGDSLYLSEGALRGQTVEFVKYKGKNRGLFKFESLGKGLIVDIPMEEIATASLIS